MASLTREWKRSQLLLLTSLLAADKIMERVSRLKAQMMTLRGTPHGTRVGKTPYQAIAAVVVASGCDEIVEHAPRRNSADGDAIREAWLHETRPNVSLNYCVPATNVVQ